RDARRVRRYRFGGRCPLPRRGDRRTAARTAAGAGADADRRPDGGGRPGGRAGRRLSRHGRGCAGGRRRVGRRRSARCRARARRCGARRTTTGSIGRSVGDGRRLLATGAGIDSQVELLRGALRTYAWGSRTAIAEFTGRPVPAAHPEAELWFGAHPGDPAWLESDTGETSLLDALVADPEGQLGAGSRARFGDVLPFLVKGLAADEPLSLQAHPSAEQAVEGYLREERLGIPVSSPVRNYRDTSHKPELLVALQPFEALAGFRQAARTRDLLQALAVS